MEFTVRFERLLALLLAAGIVAIVTRRLKVPYTIGLVLAGIGLSLFPLFEDLPLSKEMLFTVFLPPLVFEAALQIRWKELRSDLPVVVLLATIGVCLSSAVTSLGMKYVAGWEWAPALLFGSLIAATDPVSVVATFKEAGVHGRLRLLVEAESLLNDGTAAVVFAVLITALSGVGAPGLAGTAWFLVKTIAGGILCGALVSGAMSYLMSRTRDNLVVFTLTTVSAYASFILAEHFHFSGILACVTAGLIAGNTGVLADNSSNAHQAVGAFWEYLGFLANSMVFMAIGVHQLRWDPVSVIAPAGIAVFFVLLGRGFAVYPCCAAFARSRLRVEGKYQSILFWGGLRGALALGLAVGLPDWVAQREIIISVTFAVVAFSIFVQGITMTPILRHFGEISEEAVNLGK